jgi:hypothetical protein
MGGAAFDLVTSRPALTGEQRGPHCLGDTRWGAKITVMKDLSGLQTSEGSNPGGAPKVYIETTVPSAFVTTRTDPGSLHRRGQTQQWWRQQLHLYDCYVSDNVLLG